MRWVIAILLPINLFLKPPVLQAQQYPFVHYTPKEGLVSARARYMFQDSNGRLFIATFGGLSIYDGERFTNYTVENGLSSNMINVVVEIANDSFLILPNVNKVQSLSRGKLKTIQTADGFCPVVNKLIKKSEGQYYALADEGLFLFSDNRFTKLPMRSQDGRDINQYFSRGIVADGKIILVTDPTMGSYPSPSYLLMYDPATQQVCIGKKPPEVFDVIVSPQHDILVATSHGLKMLDKAAMKKGEIMLATIPLKYMVATNAVAHVLYFDKQQNLWMALGDEVMKIDQKGKKKTFSMKNGLLVNRQYSLFQDKEQSMWFINDQTGVSKLTNQQFEYYDEIRPGFKASDIYADIHSDSVWFMDYAHKKLIVQLPNHEEEYDIEGGAYWLTNQIPSYKRNYLTGQFEIYRYDEFQKGKIRPRLIFSWRDSMTGVPKVNFAIPDQHGNLLFSNESINAVLPNDQIVSYPLGYFGDQILVAPGNHVWVINRANKLFLFQTHPNDPNKYFELLRVYDSIVTGGARSLTMDVKGNIWIGTRDRGLFGFVVDSKFNLELKYHFTSKSGLSDNCILSLHGDEVGNIWACSPVGLDKIQQRGNKWMVENTTRSNNIYQKIEKVNTTRSGDHWILTTNGIIRIKPFNSLSSESFNPNILLTEIRAGKDTLNPTTNNLPFAHDQNDVWFLWAVPTFIDEKQTLFSYRLDGSNADHWSEPSTESTIRYMNLAPGKYKFHVKAIFPNGLYPDKETSFSFEILPPWWSSWWFKVLVLAAIALAVLLLVRGYTRKKLEKQRHALEKQQAVERERTRIASDMHDDMGAGLSSIRFLSEKIKQTTASETTTNDIGKIVNISAELVENMNEIIWAMNEKNDTLEDLLFYTRSFAKEYCEENEISCFDDFPDTIPSQFVSGEVRRNIFLAVKESLHNIIKHATATEVHLIVSANQELSVTIRDNGKGFSFDNASDYSTGNGLKNMQRRIESIGGRFILMNGEGVTIKMEVPLQNL